MSEETKGLVERPTMAAVVRDRLTEGRVRAMNVHEIVAEIHDYEDEVARLTSEVEALRGALEPFAHPDLSKAVVGVTSDYSPAYQKDKAVLTLGDFRRARRALEGGREDED